jgi:hypothetical protein
LSGRCSGAQRAPGDNSDGHGVRKRNDFFVKHLLGMDPPEWNRMEEIPIGTARARDER